MKRDRRFDDRFRFYDRRRVFVDDLTQGAEHLLVALPAVDLPQFSMQGVVSDQRCRLVFVDPHPVGDGLFVVVGAPLDPPAAEVADLFDDRRRSEDVVVRSAGLADPPPFETLHEMVWVTFQAQDQVQRQIEFLEDALQRVSLGRGPGKADE